MAAADLKAELECSVCLDIYTDPVMLQCGHNFCRVCIDHVLDTQKSGGYSCPECRQRFHQRPAPSRNMKLRNIIENFLPTQTPEREEPGVSCSYCGDPPQVVCLHCDISLCDKHRSVHENSQEHIFTERKSRKCSVHSKLLEYYCTEHETCVCVSCCIVGEHTGHKMESLEEAAARTKNKMNKALQKLLTKRENMEERVQNLQESKNKVEVKEADDTDRVTAMFMDISRQLEVLKKEVLRDISGQSKRVTLSMMDLVQELEKKKDELSRKIRHIEMLCNMTDSLTVLQETSTSDLCGTEDGDNEDRQRDNKLLGDGRDLNTAGILHNLHITLSNIMCEVNRKKLTSQQAHPHIGTKGTGDISAPSYVEPQPSSTLKGTYQPGIKILAPSNNTDIILNINTAGNDLWISDNRKSVSSSVFTHKYPETPGRFQSAQVLSNQSFSSGHHYWEVDVERSQVWTVGMCYPSIDRRGCHSEIGWNSKSWGLHKSWLKNQYSVLYNRKWIRLPDRVTSNKVRICLDYEAGHISFYDLCVPIRHLHTFNATFTEPLCAILWVGEGCVKICKRDQECNDLVLGDPRY